MSRSDEGPAASRQLKRPFATASGSLRIKKAALKNSCLTTSKCVHTRRYLICSLGVNLLLPQEPAQL